MVEKTGIRNEVAILDSRGYNPRQKSLAHLNQIARKCVDKALWKKIPRDIIRVGDPLSPDNVVSG